MTLVVLAGVLASGCSDRTAPSSAPVSLGAELFAARCAKCHGLRGDGVGAATAGFTPTPARFTDPAFQQRATDAYLKRVIVGGGASVGKAAAMPAFPDLAGSPALEALVAHLRGLGQGLTGSESSR